MRAHCPDLNSPSAKKIQAEIGLDAVYAIYDDLGHLPENPDPYIKNFIEDKKHISNLENARSQEAIIAGLEATQELIQEVEGKYVRTDKPELKIQRVSDIVNERKSRLRTAYTGPQDNFYAKKGTIVHKYFEYMLGNLLDGKKVYWKPSEQHVINALKDNPEFKDEKNNFYQLKKSQFEVMLKASREMATAIQDIQKAIDPKGKIKHFQELVLYDENNQRAGTADLVVVFSDGSAALYDYKTFSAKRGEKPSTVKQEDWTVQLSNYANMLKDNYGIPSLRHSRVIPINVNFSKFDRPTQEWVKKISEGFQTLAIYTRENDLKHLKPIPVAEQSKFNSLQDLIRKLEARQSELNNKLDVAKTKSEAAQARRELKSINKSMQSLLVDADAEATLDKIRAVVRRFNNNLHKTQHEDGYLSYAELYEGYKEMEIYENLSSDFLDVLGVENADAETREKVQNKVRNASSFVIETKQKIFQELLNRLGGEQLLSSGQGISNAGKLFHGLENWHIPIFQKLDTFLKSAKERARLDTEARFRQLDKVDKPFKKWAKANGFTGASTYDVLFDRTTKRMHSEYSKEFEERKYKLFRKANLHAGHPDKAELTAEEKAWITENFEIDVAAVQEAESQLKDNLKRELAREEISKKEYDRRMKVFYEFTDPRKSKNAFYKGIKGREKVFLKPSKNAEKYKSAEYNRIQANPEVKAYYDVYNEIISDFRDTYGISVIGHNFVPIVHQGFVNTIAEKGLWGVLDTWDTVKQKLKIREHDEIRGVTSTTGESVKQVPLLFVEGLTKDPSESEVQAIEEEVSVIYERGTQQFESEVSRRKAAKSYELGKEFQSVDLTQSLKLFIAQANEHRELTSIEPMIKGLQIIINSEKMKNKLMSKADRPVWNKWINSIAEKMGAPDLGQAFDKFVDRLLYKQQYDKELMSSKKYSSNKIAQMFLNFFSNTAIGANLILVGANYSTARFNMYMLSKENMHFNKDDWNKALKWFGQRDDRYQNVYDFVQPTTRDYLQEQAFQSGINFVSRHFRSHTLFKGHILGDDRIDTAISVAMSLKYRVDSDGKIKNPELVDLIDKDAPTVADAIKRADDGGTYIEGLTIHELQKYRSKVRKIAQRTKGMTNEFQKGLIYSTMAGSAVMHLRSWLPGMATTRFGRLEYDTTLESLEQGRFAVAMGEIIGHGFNHAVKSVLTLATEAVTMGLYTHEINMDVVDAKLQKFINENKSDNPEIVEQLGKTLQERRQKFIKMHRAKLNSFMAELRVYLAFLVLVQLLGGLNWDDEEEGNLFTWTAADLARRALLEISFWMSPSSTGDIMRSPFPIIGLLTRLGQIGHNSIVQTGYFIRGRDPKAKIHPFHYSLKTIPVINQGMRILRVFDPPRPKRSAMDKVFWEED